MGLSPASSWQASPHNLGHRDKSGDTWYNKRLLEKLFRYTRYLSDLILTGKTSIESMHYVWLLYPPGHQFNVCACLPHYCRDQLLLPVLGVSSGQSVARDTPVWQHPTPEEKIRSGQGQALDLQRKVHCAIEIQMYSPFGNSSIWNHGPSLCHCIALVGKTQSIVVSFGGKVVRE